MPNLLARSEQWRKKEQKGLAVHKHVENIKNTHTHIGSKHNHLTFIGLKQILLWDVINLTQNTSFGNCIVQNQFAFTKELVLTELLGLNKHEGSLIWFSSILRGTGNFGDASMMSNLGMPVQLSNSLHVSSGRYIKGDILPT